MLLSSLDMSTAWSRLPMRFHFNLGYRSPNGNRQPISGEPSDLPISKIDIFNLNSFKYQAVLGSLSAEAFFRWAVAFVEFNTEYAIATGSESLGFGDNRHSVSVGGIWLPHESFGIITAGEVGIGGDSTKHSAGIPHNIPWQAYVGVKFKTNADQLFRAIGSIRGRISDADTGFPLAETKITLIGEVGLPQSTNMVGGFQFESLSPKTYQLRIERQGYQPQTKSVEVESGESAFVEILLDGTGPKNGNLNIFITDLQTGDPVSKAYIKI